MFRQHYTPIVYPAANDIDWQHAIIASRPTEETVSYREASNIKNNTKTKKKTLWLSVANRKKPRPNEILLKLHVASFEAYSIAFEILPSCEIIPNPGTEALVPDRE